MKVNFRNIDEGTIMTLVVIIAFCCTIVPICYNNFQDHRNIFPRPDPKEYVYKCPECGYITKSTHKRCPGCHELLHYNQIKTEINK